MMNRLSITTSKDSTQQIEYIKQSGINIPSTSLYSMERSTNKSLWSEQFYDCIGLFMHNINKKTKHKISQMHHISCNFHNSQEAINLFEHHLQSFKDQTTNTSQIISFGGKYFSPETRKDYTNNYLLQEFKKYEKNYYQDELIGELYQQKRADLEKSHLDIDEKNKELTQYYKYLENNIEKICDDKLNNISIFDISHHINTRIIPDIINGRYNEHYFTMGNSLEVWKMIYETQNNLKLKKKNVFQNIIDKHHNDYIKTYSIIIETVEKIFSTIPKIVSLPNIYEGETNAYYDTDTNKLIIQKSEKQLQNQEINYKTPQDIQNYIESEINELLKKT